MNQNDQTVGLYGRNISRKSHLYLKGSHKGVFNYKAAKANDGKGADEVSATETTDEGDADSNES